MAELIGALLIMGIFYKGFKEILKKKIEKEISRSFVSAFISGSIGTTVFYFTSGTVNFVYFLATVLIFIFDYFRILRNSKKEGKV